MKVFISHSWKNKLLATRIADHLRIASHDVWLDEGKLSAPGNIQDMKDELIGSMDALVLLWNLEASESGSVAAELYTASRLKKLIIPCKLDETPLDAFPEVKKLKGIFMDDPGTGIQLLSLALSNYENQYQNLPPETRIKAVNVFLGEIQFAEFQQRAKENTPPENLHPKKSLISTVGENEKDAYDKLNNLYARGLEVQQFLRAKMKELEQGIHRQELCRQVLHDLENFPENDNGIMQKFISNVREICNSFSDNEQLVVIEKFRLEMQMKLEEAHSFLKRTTGWLLGDAFEPLLKKMEYFYLSAADNLEWFCKYGEETEDDDPVNAVCADLLRYIQTPGGVIHNNQFAIIGYTDDVYFIHKLISCLQLENMLPANDEKMDWKTIDEGMAVAFNLINPVLKDHMIQEVQKYYESFLEHIKQSEIQKQSSPLELARQLLWRAKIVGLQNDIDYMSGHNYP
ncbi:MAG: toll/interleukin-1 receptor domain-containing protein [Bacteroidetes bacterium]|nr:toll/interleukin-1 receptor domain-containing protein [Bacteroidota bacterium]